MKSYWNDTEAERIESAAGDNPADRALALRVYTSQLIGREVDLVLHGGGNTSVKVKRPDGSGVDRDVIHVKGSGWDLATIEAPGLPGMRLEPLLEARNIPDMKDEEMVALLRTNMLDDSGPTPSVEALLHAFLPYDYVDHTHSAAALAIANQPNAAELSRQIFGEKLCVVPYVMPGFKLSHAADEIFRREGRDCEGMFLVNHGLFSFSDDARISYERIIDFTSACEDYLADNGAALTPPEENTKVETQPRVVENLGAALSEWAFFGGGVTLDLRDSPAIRRYLAMDNLQDVATRGTATPDHVIRIKPRPVIGASDFSSEDWKGKVDDFAQWYESYFQRNVPNADEPKTMLDPLPRVALIPGTGIVGIGRNAKEAGIAADLAEQTARIVWSAEQIGRFTPLDEGKLFQMEYWSLEQAKLQKAA
ncbi:class II aldolase/adducin family protein [Notoacmeibacter ruber]|uniref:Class II aldolase n=1 Tax=Notoacmeibacter ruber TaxID=2670375 RepID=A0A3L7J910_9HYPH|nr:class II aldolase/adducin family protein [Notoacmeibacter ruber]RLQ86855.1 class II aldolase [Notoacmeibacter ruber]